MHLIQYFRPGNLDVELFQAVITDDALFVLQLTFRMQTIHFMADSV